jgi:hypothetical protein
MMTSNRTSKFNARRVVVGDHSFDSAAEGRRYATLAALERAGKIAGLELQPRFDCVVAGVKICSYVADFRYRRDGVAVVEDVKGVRTAVYRLKRKLAEACHPGLVITEIPAAGAGRPRRR